jgi:alpha-1,2-mannosyltransferase
MDAERAVGAGGAAEQTSATPEAGLPAAGWRAPGSARSGTARVRFGAGRFGAGRFGALRDPVTLTIWITTLLALGLRVYYLSRPGFLFGVTEYDDGPYFGSAVRLTQGILPYRDFVLVQPPGITLLMLPAALLAKVTGTAWGMAIGRVLTAAAGTAGVALAGRLVRHRGVLATLVACGVLAVFPDSVAAAHTVLVEPWLVLFCLIGAVLVFDGDRLVKGRRMLWGGVAFGFAGAIETWAIAPVLIVIALGLAEPAPRALSRLRRPAPFVGGAAAGFCVPVLPFAAAAPRGIYQSLVVAQVGPRSGFPRVPLLSRLTEMAGLTDIRLPMHVFGLVTLSSGQVVWSVTIILVLLAVGVPALLNLVTGELPTALEWFALGSTELVVVMFLWPLQFHYHFAGFLAPFLGLAIALPSQRLLAFGRVGVGHVRVSRVAAGAAAVLLVLFTFVQARNESRLTPVVGPSAVAQADRIIPPGACVLSDSAALLLVADRFVSGEPGCGVIDDGLGSDLALSHGLTPATGAAHVPAVAKLWAQAFEHAQFVWFTDHSWRRVAWPPPVLAYFQRDFKPILTDRYGDTLYRRIRGQPV